MPSDPDRPRNRKPAARTRRTIDEFDADAANHELAQTLQRNRLQRKARARGVQLRHSAYGYSLVDSKRTQVDGRVDLSLDEAESLLDSMPAITPGTRRPRGD